MRVGVIGAGFGGITVSAELLRAGIDVVVFERGPTVGGVWRENTYPGAACDVPSPYYALSYRPSTEWPRRYSHQPDILAYLERVADELGVRRRVLFGVEVTGADWDEAAGTWSVHLDGRPDEVVDVLVPAVGQLSRPSVPTIEGADTFGGIAFHSARWRHDVDLAGRRVAVIGTGASAIQFVPEVARTAGHVDLFQRTPPHLLPRPDSAYAKAYRRRGAMRFERLVFWLLGELLTVAFLYSKPLGKLVETISRAHMRRQTDPATFRKVWPTYPVGCKRILFTNDYLPALMRDNVEVTTTGIECITPAGVRTADGVEHPADVIVYGTGFTPNDFLAPLAIRGVGGRDLRAQWGTGARAYLGMVVPHFPNLFLMYGPNTNLNSGSIVFMLECQARYVRQAVEQVDRTGPSAVRPAVAARFDQATQDRLENGVWTQCSSWYRNQDGRVTTNWPGLVSEYRRRTAEFDPTDFERVVPA